MDRWPPAQSSPRTPWSPAMCAAAACCEARIPTSTSPVAGGAPSASCAPPEPPPRAGCERPTTTRSRSVPPERAAPALCSGACASCASPPIAPCAAKRLPRRASPRPRRRPPRTASTTSWRAARSGARKPSSRTSTSARSKRRGPPQADPREPGPLEDQAQQDGEFSFESEDLPAAQTPIQPDFASGGELKLTRAIEVFNAGEGPRRIAGVARSLGAPQVGVRLLEDSPAGSRSSWPGSCAGIATRSISATRPPALSWSARAWNSRSLPEQDRLVNAGADERGALAPLALA